MSTRARGPRDRDELVRSLLEAGRDYSTAAVVFHAAVADRFGLGVTALKTLDLLQRLGPLPAGDIAAHTGLATPSVTSLLDRLEKKRFVRRGRDPHDRRRVVVSLTSTFEKTVAPLFEPLARRMTGRFREYDAEQIALLVAFLTSGARAMREEATKLAAPTATRHGPLG